MTVFSDLETLLTGLGYKVFANKKLDSVKQAVVYKSISQRIVGSHQGDSTMRIERVQISCFALKADTLMTMTRTLEDALAFYDGTFTSIPTESKIWGYDDTTSTHFCHRDFYLVYKE